MNHKEKLLQAYENSTHIEDIKGEIPDSYQNFIFQIAKIFFRLNLL
jgi:hypothetical protein